MLWHHDRCRGILALRPLTPWALPLLLGAASRWPSLQCPSTPAAYLLDPIHEDDAAHGNNGGSYGRQGIWESHGSGGMGASQQLRYSGGWEPPRSRAVGRAERDAHGGPAPHYQQQQPHAQPRRVGGRVHEHQAAQGQRSGRGTPPEAARPAFGQPGAPLPPRHAGRGQPDGRHDDPFGYAGPGRAAGQVPRLLLPPRPYPSTLQSQWQPPQQQQPRQQEQPWGAYGGYNYQQDGGGGAAGCEELSSGSSDEMYRSVASLARFNAAGEDMDRSGQAGGRLPQGSYSEGEDGDGGGGDRPLADDGGGDDGSDDGSLESAFLATCLTAARNSLDLRGAAAAAATVRHGQGAAGRQAPLGRHFYNECYAAIRSTVSNADAGGGMTLPINTAAGVAGSPAGSGSPAGGPTPEGHRDGRTRRGPARRDGPGGSSPGEYFDVRRSSVIGSGSSGVQLAAHRSGSVADADTAAASHSTLGSLEGVLTQAVLALHANQGRPSPAVQQRG